MSILFSVDVSLPLSFPVPFILSIRFPARGFGGVYWVKQFLKRKGAKMGDKGKKDKDKREEQKKEKHTLKEKREQKKDKDKDKNKS